MSDITLSSAVRDNLLSLQNTQVLTNRTQGRLSTGQKVASAVDDPVAYFQAKALGDRATDLNNYKANIDQGVSSLSTALQGITSIQAMVNQLKGLALNAQSATSAQIGQLVTQFNSLRTQINLLAGDTQYQGLNLIAGSGSSLTISFSNLTASTLSVNSVDVTVGANGLNIGNALTSNGGFAVSYAGSNVPTSLGGNYSGGCIITTTYAGTATSLSQGSFTFSYGGDTVTVNVASAGAGPSAAPFTTTSVFSVGQTLQFAVQYTATVAYDVRTGISADQQNGYHFAVEYGTLTNTAGSWSGGNGFTAGALLANITLQGLTSNSLASGSYTFNWNGETLTFIVGSAGMTSSTFTTTQSFVNGSALQIYLSTGHDINDAVNQNVVNAGQNQVYGLSATTTAGFVISPTTTGGVYYAPNNVGSTIYGAVVSGSLSIAGVTGQLYLDQGLQTEVNSVITSLNANLGTLRANAQTLGTNVALLNTRLDFTNNYVNLLQGGSGKLTLADLNAEGANLLALQTRQQLGIQSLSFAGQNERAVLSLFR